jgi:GNAT superfamily N-acetyltransferase
MVAECSFSDLLAAFPDDRFLRHDVDAGRVIRCAITTTAWSIRGRSAYWSADWVTAWSYAANAGAVSTDISEHFRWQTSRSDASSVRGITCNEGAANTSTQSIEAANDWSWFWTDAEHSRSDLSNSVVEIDHHDSRLLPLLSHSPTASHERDGQPPHKWFGIESDGELLSVAAVKRMPRCFDIQSVVTHSDARCRGLSTQVCGHATAWALQHAPVVALGMMTDNQIAERMYTGLGYVLDKRWQSTRFVPSGEIGERTQGPGQGADDAMCADTVCGEQ